MPSAKKPATAASGRWKISFGPGAIFLGCVVAAFVFMLITFALALGDSEAGFALTGQDSAFRVAVYAGGAAFLVFMLIGPALSFGLGWLLRRQANGSVHVLAFGALGVVVGALAGLIIDGLGLASLLGPMVGVCAAVARMAVAPFQKV